ncbi:MAG: AAA family ATPase [Actinobacteria bacterium]|nr:AAA family ATPase [Actinomycetota bacterium]
MPPKPNGRAVAGAVDLAKPAPEPEVSGARDVARLTVKLAAGKSMVAGGRFVFDVPERPEPVWGSGGGVAWSRGEYVLFCGPTGVGKTTLEQQVALARMGLLDDVLGMPVEPDDRNVLLLALDRPDQIARSMRRMVGEPDRAALDAKLKVWRGPLPGSIMSDRELIGAMADEAGAGMVLVDSLKDMVAKLTDDEVGQAVKEALSIPCLEGIQVAANHHQRKRQQGAGQPNTLADVYGSTWLTAGAGSVLMLWGEAGDAVVELTHLKQPAEALGPWTLLHDHDHGVTTVENKVDLFDVVRTSSGGLTAEGAARAIFRKDNPARNEVEKARRRLDQLVRRGVALKEEGRSGGAGGGAQARYYGIDRQHV